MTDYTDPDGPPPPSMMCGVCDHVLTLTVRFESLLDVSGTVVGELQLPEWGHPGGMTFDHDPVPVPTPDDLELVAEICDYCSAPEVAGYAIATPFKTAYRGIEHRDNGSWSCCKDCRALLEANRGNALIARATEILTAKHGPAHAEAIAALLEAFLAHFTGEIIDRHTPSRS